MTIRGILEVLQKHGYTIPSLEFNPQMVGPTHYIDRVLCSMMTHPVMQCRDDFGREFISIKTKFIYDPIKKNQIQDNTLDLQNEVANNEENQLTPHKTFEAVGTVFSRYSDLTNVLAYGTCYNHHDSFFYDSRIRSEIELNVIILRLMLCLSGQTIRSLQKTITNTQHESVVGDGDYLIHIPSIRAQILHEICQVLYKDVASVVLMYI